MVDLPYLTDGPPGAGGQPVGDPHPRRSVSIDSSVSADILD